MTGRARIGISGALCAAVVGTVATLSIGGASASPACVKAATPNGAVTTSPNGAVLYGSPCSDRIVVTSALVREVHGGEGDDVIFVNPWVEVVIGGEGDDTIYGELPQSGTATGVAYSSSAHRSISGSIRHRDSSNPVATASLEQKNCQAGVSCYGGEGSQELIGSSGNDKIFGQRGNDVLKGNGGNDELFGGVGDECVWGAAACTSAGITGGDGNDLLAGGLGTDWPNGNEGSDLIRGDGTIDTLQDSGPTGTDTLSFATGVTPGFSGSVTVSGFPADSASEERGVHVRLSEPCSGEYEACNNEARYGGGFDNIVSGFENVIGTPFADVIVGSTGDNRIDGGGGADAIYGNYGNDVLYGGADGDFLNGEWDTDVVYGQGGTNNCLAETANECSGSAESVTQRDRSKISVGFIVSSPPETLSWIGLYMTGSTGVDKVKATYETGLITFTTEGESAQFDTSSGAKTPGCFTYETTKVECGVSKSLDAITLAGMSGNDSITTEGFPETTTPVLLGGEGGDVLTANNGTEDMLVDGNGSGEDSLSAGSKDDALINNEGKDTLQGGLGNDLLLSVSNCDGDTLQGAASNEGDSTAVNSSSWAKLPTGSPGVVADLEDKKAGTGLSEAGVPICAESGKEGTLANIDDLEGSSGADKLFGDSLGNNMFGRPGKDELWGRGGDDRLEAQGDETVDKGGGGGHVNGDTCVLESSEVKEFAGCEK